MISVLIPAFNRNVTSLVKEVERQFILSNTSFEMICFNDNSDVPIIDKGIYNEETSNLKMHTSIHTVGSIKARQKLAEMATYDWLLFLDSDVAVINDSFIQNYLSARTTGYDCIFGGFTYQVEQKVKGHLLRYEYGRRKEAVAASKRNKNPYKVIISANYLIRKKTFVETYHKIEMNGYGSDNFFGSLLKHNNVSVLHIENPVLHLGIEESSVYLKKTEKASEALLKLHQENNVPDHSNDLLKVFQFVKSIKLGFLFRWIYKNFGGLIKSNLLGNSPKIFLLQLYKLSYMFYMENKMVKK